jgi:hypothetical protein
MTSLTKLYAGVYFDSKRKCSVAKKHESCYLYTVFILPLYLDSVTVNTTSQAFEAMQLTSHTGKMVLRQWMFVTLRSETVQ